MKIDINNYLTKEEMKEIVEEEFRDNCMEVFRDEDNMDRIITNISYEIIFKKINEIMPNVEQILLEKVKQRCEDVTQYEVFRSKRDYCRDNNSLAQDILEQSVENNKNIINEKVIEILNNLNEKDITYEIRDIIEEKIDNLFTKKEEE